MIHLERERELSETLVYICATITPDADENVGECVRGWKENLDVSSVGRLETRFEIWTRNRFEISSKTMRRLVC